MSCLILKKSLYGAPYMSETHSKQPLQPKWKRIFLRTLLILGIVFGATVLETHEHGLERNIFTQFLPSIAGRSFAVFFFGFICSLFASPENKWVAFIGASYFGFFATLVGAGYL